jgi:hypothetical protein
VSEERRKYEAHQHPSETPCERSAANERPPVAMGHKAVVDSGLSKVDARHGGSPYHGRR